MHGAFVRVPRCYYREAFAAIETLEELPVLT